MVKMIKYKICFIKNKKYVNLIYWLKKNDKRARVI